MRFLASNPAFSAIVLIIYLSLLTPMGADLNQGYVRMITMVIHFKAQISNLCEFINYPVNHLPLKRMSLNMLFRQEKGYFGRFSLANLHF